MPSPEVLDEGPGKSAGSTAKKSAKSGKQKKADKSKKDAVPREIKTTNNNNSNNKSLVNELKLFQNSNLLNQQDPLEQLHEQINQLIQDEDVNLPQVPSMRPIQAMGGPQQDAIINSQASHQLRSSEFMIASHHQPSLSAPNPAAIMQYNNHLALQQQQVPLDNRAMNYHLSNFVSHESNQEVFTVKKGVLWQQQNHDKFHQRLFSRWKKRYFILTTNYLVCFKRSTSRVGHSEMGRFLYKIALADVAKTEWLRPKRTDKGAIVLQVKDKFDLFLWSKKEIEEWMLLIKESIERLRLRKGAHIAVASNGYHIHTRLAMPEQRNGLEQGVYENATAPQGPNGDMKQSSRHLGHSIVEERAEIDAPRGTPDMTINSQTKGSSRTSSGSRRPANDSTVSANGPVPATSSDPLGHEIQGSRYVTGRKEEASLMDDENHVPHESATSNFETIGEQPSAGRLSRDRGESTPLKGGADVLAAGLKCPSQQQSDCERRISTTGAGLREQTDAAANGASDNQTPADRLAAATAAVHRSSVLERPAANLIRRDDSWHSLVSLTHVGIQAGHQKQSLYARHIMPTNDRPSANGGQTQRQRAINIESTATPLRGKLPTRQHSIQSYSHRLPPPPPLGRQQRLHEHAHSFDVPSQIPNSPSLHGHQQTTALHLQRLLQLQLLHNSNNVDYIRTNNGANRNADYQIYGPESIATSNHYGYYSMRSNLKSAASEFSFIRPSSSSFQQAAAQPTTPLHAGLAHDNSSYILGENAFRGARGPDREACIVQAHQENIPPDHNNNYPNEVGLVSLDGGKNLNLLHGNPVALQRTPDRPIGHEIAAPNRDLPLKPNRKRAAPNDPKLEKNSLGSSIACFFRRAFSRRSKRRPKLVESCSSSLAAFDSNLDQIQVAQSAFSTGSKSARAERGPAVPPNGQPQRMIDLIEAFATKTALDQKQCGPAMQNYDPMGNANQQKMGAAEHQVGQFGSIRPKFIRDQVGSPLHKSNSISTSSGFAGINEMAYRNQRLVEGENTSMRDQMSSPLITRSTKVMSANLTPLFSQKRSFDHPGEEIMSPRNMRHMPRPSSIYGQPSLISSPVISTATRNGGDNFGLHRSSMYGSGHRERVNNIDFRRQRTVNAPFLDTTREVAEEVSSPTSDMRELLPKEQLYDHEINARLSYNVQDSSLIRSSKLDAYYRNQRQAVVNPILQSPTMNAIYDNHSTPSHRLDQMQYDNHRATSFHDPDRDASGYSRPRIMMQNRMSSQTFEALASPIIQSGRRISQSSGGQSALYTPTREMQTRRQNQLVNSISTDADRVFVRSKPAAIVAPTTPHQQSSYTPQASSQGDIAPNVSSSMRFIGQASPMRTQQQQQPQHLAGVAISPVAARRAINQAQQPHYQQSPLVDEQTRILKRGGRVQTTIIASENLGGSAKPPPSEPSQANGQVNPGPNGIVSSQRTRNDATPSHVGNDLSVRKDLRSKSSSFEQSCEAADASGTKNVDRSSDGLETSDKGTSSGSSHDDRSAQTGSGSTNSSVSRNSPRSSSLALSGNDTGTGKSRSMGEDGAERGFPGQKREDDKTKDGLLNGKRRGSSVEQSDELTSQTGSIDEPDEKNWVNSKLAQ